MRSVKKNVLLNPGPATTTDSVKYAQIVPDVCPREEEFSSLLSVVLNKLTKVVSSSEDYTSVLFGGSGTAAVEAVFASAIGDNDNVLIINNGAYGKRMCEIAQIYRINFHEYCSPADEPIDLLKLKKVILEESKITHIAVVHNETSTGLLNDLREIGRIAKELRLTFIVDAMSSFGAIPIDMALDYVHYLCASSNKNLQGMAGVSFVICEINKLHQIKPIRPKVYYLDLFSQYQFFVEHRQTRFTPPVQVIYALYQALQELDREGIDNRYRRYVRSWEELTNSLKEMKIEYLVNDAYHSKIITAICMPTGVKFDELHQYFKDRGMTIYPGKNSDSNTFRVANIGDIDYEDIKLFICYFKEFLEQ